MRDYHARRQSPESIETERRASRAWFDKTNADTKQAASNARGPWTRTELEQALRRDVSVAELARQLGRSYSAVLHVRHKAENNPAWLKALREC